MVVHPVGRSFLKMGISMRNLVSAWPARLLVVALVSLLVGCGQKSPYELARVHGKVTVDGQPLPMGRVMFAPRATGNSIDAGKPAFGQLQPDGTFVLGTYDDDDGAVVGSHWVTVFGVREEDTKWPANLPRFSRLNVPGSAVTVAADKENEIDIKLTTQQLQQLGRAFDD